MDDQICKSIKRLKIDSEKYISSDDEKNNDTKLKNSLIKDENFNNNNKFSNDLNNLNLKIDNLENKLDIINKNNINLEKKINIILKLLIDYNNNDDFIKNNDNLDNNDSINEKYNSDNIKKKEYFTNYII